MAYTRVDWTIGDEMLRHIPLKRKHSKRVLLFHMGGVLGHLTRVLALAEEIDAAGHEAILATSDGSLPLLRALRQGVRCVKAYDEPSFKAVRAVISSIRKGRDADRSNLFGMGPQDRRTQLELAGVMERMAASDRALIRRVSPDAIVTDYRLSPGAVPDEFQDKLFQISHLVGFPSLHKRVTGRYPYMLEEGRLLVPGIRQIEYRQRTASQPTMPNTVMCGLFRWQGWARLRRAQTALQPVEALLFFGSTGQAGNGSPALCHLGERGISTRWVTGTWRKKSKDAHGTNVDLEQGLASAEMLVCHGGHGTVMEALLHGRPVIVLPSNPEQLEIGHRLEKMGLGLLVRQTPETLTQKDLVGMIARVREDREMRCNVLRYSELLQRSQTGAKIAAGVVLGLHTAKNR